MRDWMTEFGRLLHRFMTYREMANELQSPDPEDDLFVKMAIVGYSFHQPTEAWGIDNLRYIQQRRHDDYSDAQLVEFEDRAQSYAQFACLSLGYMLGLFQSGQIDDVEFLRGEALLPGFLALHSGELPVGVEGEGQ